VKAFKTTSSSWRSHSKHVCKFCRKVFDAKRTFVWGNSSSCKTCARKHAVAKRCEKCGTPLSYGTLVRTCTRCQAAKKGVHNRRLGAEDHRLLALSK
jgi:hypothetical protein